MQPVLVKVFGCLTKDEMLSQSRQSTGLLSILNRIPQSRTGNRVQKTEYLYNQAKFHSLIKRGYIQKLGRLLFVEKTYCKPTRDPMKVLFNHAIFQLYDKHTH